MKYWTMVPWRFTTKVHCDFSGNVQVLFASYKSEAFAPHFAGRGSSVRFSEVTKHSRLWIKSSCTTCALVFRIFSWPLLGLGAAGLTFRIFAQRIVVDRFYCFDPVRWVPGVRPFIHSDTLISVRSGSRSAGRRVILDWLRLIWIKCSVVVTIARRTSAEFTLSIVKLKTSIETDR